MGKNRDNFSKRVADMLGRRVAYICSNPKCRKLTIFPSQDPEKAISTGVAAHISAAAPGGPRYDPSVTQRQRSSIENGIFLCATCATMIDKNSGLDFPAELLRKWKADHEEWMRDGRHEPVARTTSALSAPLLELYFDGGSTVINLEKGRVTESERNDRIKDTLSERVIRLDIQIANKGSTPASDIDVFIDVKGPFMLYDEKQLRQLWDVYPLSLFDNPEAFINRVFERPKGTDLQQMAGILADAMGFSLFKDLIPPKSNRTDNSSTGGARAHLSNDRVTVHFNKLKQNLIKPVQSLFVVFHSYEDVSTFHIPFRLNAEELPNDVHGKLEVIVTEKR